MLWFVGSIWTCSSHPTKAEYGGLWRAAISMWTWREKAFERESRSNLGLRGETASREQHFVVFFALSTWWVYRPGLTSLLRSLSDRSHAMLPAPMTSCASANTYARQRYLWAWDILCQILWEFGGRNLFIYKQIFFLLTKCANHWDKRTFSFTSCWLARIHLANRTVEEPCVTSVTIILFEIT